MTSPESGSREPDWTKDPETWRAIEEMREFEMTVIDKLQPLTAEEFATVSKRHAPHERAGFTWCTRCFDELWPCDAARLLATVGDAYAAGALAEYREARR